MSGVNMPSQQHAGLLDAVMKGVAVARDIYGIKHQMTADSAEAAKGEADKAERERIASGKLNPGEQIKLAAGGAAISDKPIEGGAKYTDATTGLQGYVGRAAKTPLQTQATKIETAGPDGKPLIKFVEPKVGDSYPAYKAPEKPDHGPKDISVAERNTLQNQYDRDPNTRKNQLVLGSYADMNSLLSEKSPASDQALIFAYMKALDPSSVVKESEAESAAALGGMAERAKAWYSKHVGGDGMLSDEQRADLANQVTNLAKSASQKQTAVDDQFRGLAKRRGIEEADLRFSILPAFKDDGRGKVASGGGLIPTAQADNKTAKPSAALDFQADEAHKFVQANLNSTDPALRAKAAHIQKLFQESDKPEVPTPGGGRP